MGRQKGLLESHESFFLVHGKAGDRLVSLRSDRYITAKAFYYGRKVKTERVIFVPVGKRDTLDRGVIVTLIE